MKTWAMNTGKAYADLVLTESATGVGTCETCGAESVSTWWCGTSDECRKCFIRSLEYWEERGGFSSEGIFDSLRCCRLPRESSRLYRSVMGAYFTALKEGNCEACAMLAEGLDMTAEEARTANLCGDCEAYFGLGGK